jgi:hypothetical protein
MRFPKWYNVRLSPEMYEAVVRLARENQQTIAAYTRQVLLAELKRVGVRVRPLRTKQTSNKQTAQAAA